MTCKYFFHICSLALLFISCVFETANGLCFDEVQVAGFSLRGPCFEGHVAGPGACLGKTGMAVSYPETKVLVVGRPQCGRDTTDGQWKF